jgi:hypothetical protein
MDGEDVTDDDYSPYGELLFTRVVTPVVLPARSIWPPDHRHQLTACQSIGDTLLGNILRYLAIDMRATRNPWCIPEESADIVRMLSVCRCWRISRVNVHAGSVETLRVASRIRDGMNMYTFRSLKTCSERVLTWAVEALRTCIRALDLSTSAWVSNNVLILPRFIHLHTLDLSWCLYLENLEWLKSSHHSCQFSDTGAIGTLHDESAFPNLRILSIEGVYMITDLKPLMYCPTLQELNANYINARSDSMPSEMQCLTALHMHTPFPTTGIERWSFCRKFRMRATLRTLSFGHSELVRNIIGLNMLPATLTDLDISHVHSLIGLEGIDTLINLRRLNISGCCTLQSTKGLDRMVYLEQLICDNCTSLCDISALHKCNSLQDLRITGSYKISEKSIKNLLDVRDCICIVRLDKLYVY